MLNALARFIERSFLPLALGCSALALLAPDIFLWMQPHIPLGLGIIMFGMGLTLEFSDFAGVFSRWCTVLLGVGLQYTIMPLLAVGVAMLFGLPLEMAVGLALVGACPGGTASNVITYLARGNVALSVVMTLVSTALAPLATPFIIYALYHARIEIDAVAMAGSVFWIVIFPLLDGLILRRVLRRLMGQRLHAVLRIFPAISILAITLIIACVMAMNRDTFLAFPLAIMAAVICHNLAGFTIGYWAARAFGVPGRDARTVSIEVGMQNSGLGVALAYGFFSHAAALPGAIFSLEQNLAGIVLARRFRRSADAEDVTDSGGSAGAGASGDNAAAGSPRCLGRGRRDSATHRVAATELPADPTFRSR